MNPARLRWGLLLIFVGGLLLLNNIGILDWWVWSELASLWPLLLIAIGIEKIFAHSKRLKFISYLAPIALFVVLGVIAFAHAGFGEDYSRSGSTYRIDYDSERDIEQIEASIILDDCDLNLRSTSSKLFRGRFKAWQYRPSVEYDVIGKKATFEISHRRAFGNWIHFEGFDNSGRWSVRFSDALPIVLECSGDRADMTLDCASLLLKKLKVDSRRGDIRIIIGDLKDEVQLTLEGEDADFRLNVPAECGLRISGVEEEMSSLMKRIDLIENGQFFISVGYDTLTPKINIDLAPEISQFSIE